MQFGFLKDNEPRVSITPSTLDKFISLGHKVLIEKNAGFQSGFPDSEYSSATFYSRKDLINNSDIILSVSSSSLGSLNDYGMLFIWPYERKQCMWMKNTYVPLSVAYIDIRGKIIAT